MTDETIGGLYDSLPPEHWVDLPEYGVRVRRWAEPPARDPSTETWRETVGLSTSAQLRETQRRLDERCTKLAEVIGALAASQQDLTRAKEELAAAQQPCAWKGLAVDAMQERDLIRAQLDDAIAGFRAKLEQARAEVSSTREPGHFGGER